MNQIIKLKVGELVSYKDIQCVIKQVKDIDTILITELVTDIPHIVHISELALSQIYKSSQSLENLTDNEWLKAKARYDIIQPLLELQPRTRQAVEHRAKEFSIHTNTLYRWLKAYESNGLITDLIRQKRNDIGITKIPIETENIITEAINKEYLTTQKKSIKKVYLAVKQQCILASLVPPYENTIRLRIRQLSEKLKLSKRNSFT